MTNVLITDTHFGTKQNSMTWLNSQLSFIYDQLIPYLKQIDDKVKFIHLGDVFDSRSSISTYVAAKVIEAFKEIRKCVDKFVIIGGNHDYYSPNSDSVDTISLLLKGLDIDIVTKYYEIDGKDLYIPWYDWEDHIHNEHDLNVIIREEQIENVYTHGDIFKDNHRMYETNVFSGHIHIPKIKNNLYNLGSCFYLDFADSNSDRGFYEINKDGVKFIPNEQSIKFWRLYNEEILDYKEKNIDKKDYIELYIDQINMVNPIYSNIINEMTKNYKNIWIIPQVKTISFDDIEDKFENYDIESMAKSMVPEDLKNKFDMILKRLNE